MLSDFNAVSPYLGSLHFLNYHLLSFLSNLVQPCFEFIGGIVNSLLSEKTMKWANAIYG